MQCQHISSGPKSCRCTAVFLPSAELALEEYSQLPAIRWGYPGGKARRPFGVGVHHPLLVPALKVAAPLPRALSAELRGEVLRNRVKELARLFKSTIGVVFKQIPPQALPARRSPFLPGQRPAQPQRDYISQQPPPCPVPARMRRAGPPRSIREEPGPCGDAGGARSHGQ